MTLMLLPAEIRELIYCHVIQAEGEEFLEYVGNGRGTVDSHFCLPLRKIRPPVLIRVCKTLRFEYLPYFFRHMSFRMYVDVQTPKRVDNETSNTSIGLQHASVQSATVLRALDHTVASWRRTSPVCTVIEKPAKDWLESLESERSARFRRVQFRLVNREGRVVATSLNIVLNSRDSEYQVEFKLDDGWNTGWTAGTMGLHDNVKEGTTQVLRALQGKCDSETGEVLDWKALEYLLEEFKLDPQPFPPPVVQLRRRLTDWSARVMLLKA